MMSRKDNNPNNPIKPLNFVVQIPRIICIIVAIVVVVGLFHVYSNGKEAFDSTLPSERMRLSKQVSTRGDAQLSKYKFVKSLWARDEKPESRENRKKLLLWESLPGLNAEISKNIKTLKCPNKKGKNWSDNDDRTKKANAWCSLIGSTSQAIDAINWRDQKTNLINPQTIRQLVNRNDEIEIIENGNRTGRYYEGNKELFELPPYDFWTGIQKFPDNRISKNGEYTLSIYPSVQEGMFEFMSKNNMVGAVFAYRPSNGDIYCMASTPGWTERNGDKLKAGAQMNKNFYSFTPGSTMKPITLFIANEQGEDLSNLQFEVGHANDEKTKCKKKGIIDSYELGEDKSKPVCCSLNHERVDSKNKPLPQSASDGLGNSCNSFFAQLAEKLDLEKAKDTLKEMNFYKTNKNSNIIDKTRYTKSAFPLEDTTKHDRITVENFIGESNLMVSPIDMAVLTALFGKLSSDKNSKVYFPRIWLPVDEKAQKEGSPELLLTEKNSVENEHIAKLSDFVSTRKESIAEAGRIWKKAYDEHYRVDNQIWHSGSTLDKRRHLDGDGLTAWSQWINMAKTGTFSELPDITDPKYNECEIFECGKKDNNGKCVKYTKKCLKNYEVPKNRTQRALSLYSEELDLAAYIVVENYSNAHIPSKIKLDSTSLKLTQLVADALGKKLDPEKQIIENEQWEMFNGTYRQKKAVTGQKPKQSPKKPKPKTPGKKAPKKGKSKKR